MVSGEAGGEKEWVKELNEHGRGECSHTAYVIRN